MPGQGSLQSWGTLGGRAVPAGSTPAPQPRTARSWEHMGHGSVGVQCSHSSELPRRNSCCSVPPFMGSDGTREKLHKVHSEFEVGQSCQGDWCSRKPMDRLAGLRKEWREKGKITSVTSSDVYLWFSGSTSAMECWECWIFCMAQTKCSDSPKPSRDTRSCSASRRSLKASLIHPRKMSEPAQQLLPCRMRDNDLCQIVF